MLLNAVYLGKLAFNAYEQLLSGHRLIRFYLTFQKEKKKKGLSPRLFYQLEAHVSCYF